MERAEANEVLETLEALEGRTFDTLQSDVWFEILGQHTARDAREAVLEFHSTPFKRNAYPGDIKSLISEAEGLRLRRCGTLDLNEADYRNGHASIERYGRLRELILTGEWTPGDYRAYRASKKSIDEFNGSKAEASVGS